MVLPDGLQEMVGGAGQIAQQGWNAGVGAIAGDGRLTRRAIGVAPVV